MKKNYSQRKPEEFNRVKQFFQWLVTSVGYANIYRISCGYKVLGRENLPKEGFYIVASNHISVVDPFLMCDAINKPVAFMAKKELFETFWSALYMDLLGAFEVDREKLQVSTIKTALGIKKTNWVLGLFPQGTRASIENMNLENINRGFAGMAKTLKAPVVPVGILGASHDERHCKATRMIFNIGEPIPYNDNTEEMVKIWSEEIHRLTNYDEVIKKFENLECAGRTRCRTKKNYARKYAKDFNILTRLYQYYAVFVIFKPLTAFFYKIKYYRNKKLDKKKNYIYAANHISYLDPFLVTDISGRKLTFMAKKELFENSNYLAKNIFRLGAFSVNREKLEASTIKSCIEVARAKWNLCIFPQGGIKKNKKIEDINLGFVALAKKMQYDIVPMSITGVEHYNWNPFKRAQIDVKMGEPISYLEDEQKIVSLWSERVAEMSGYELA